MWRRSLGILLQKMDYGRVGWDRQEIDQVTCEWVSKLEVSI